MSARLIFLWEPGAPRDERRTRRSLEGLGYLGCTGNTGEQAHSIARLLKPGTRQRKFGVYPIVSRVTSVLGEPADHQQNRGISLWTVPWFQGRERKVHVARD